MNIKTNGSVAIQHQKLADFHDKMEAITSSMQNATNESGDKSSPDIALPDCSELVPFTGYYPMETGMGTGAFISIDTTEYYSPSPLLPYYAAIEINVSMDGITSTTYPFDFDTQFDGTTLIMPDVLNLVFTREYDEGKLTSFTGTIGTTDVSGYTRFNPVALENFVGTYKQIDPPTGEAVLSIASDKDISFDFNDGTGVLTKISSYSYVPAMYVLLCSDSSSKKYTLMLGTAGKLGLAVSVQESGSARMAVTILPE